MAGTDATGASPRAAASDGAAWSRAALLDALGIDLSGVDRVRQDATQGRHPPERGPRGGATNSRCSFRRGRRGCGPPRHTRRTSRRRRPPRLVLSAHRPDRAAAPDPPDSRRAASVQGSRRPACSLCSGPGACARRSGSARIQRPRRGSAAASWSCGSWLIGRSRNSTWHPVAVISSISSTWWT